MPEVLGQVPAALLAEEIATPGDGQLKALFTVVGNPVISVPDSARLEAALPELECMISVDNYLNETTGSRTCCCPGPSPLETPHYDELLWGWAARSGGNWSDPVFPMPADRPHEGQIVARLGWLCTGGTNVDFDFESLDDAWFAALCRSQGLDAQETIARYDEGGPERIVDLSIRTGPWGDRYGEVPDGLTLEMIKAQPHGIDMGPMVPRAREMVCTPDGMIDLAPEYIVGDVPRLRARIDRVRRRPPCWSAAGTSGRRTRGCTTSRCW